MNKYQLYKQIRQELAAGCDNELKAVSAILEHGIESISGAGVNLDVAVADSVNSMSEAGRVFRDELNESMRLILERYRRNLQKEISSLGLDDVRVEHVGQPSRPIATHGHNTTAERPTRPGNGALQQHEPA